MTCDFSIIVPVYKAQMYLRQCLDSILGQTFPAFELILVDDGSPDGSGDICDEYAQKDGRITVIHQENAGPVAARRNGLLRARAEYICFVDADDRVVPRWLETVKGHIDANARPDVVLYDYVQDDGKTDWPLLAQAGYYDKARLERDVYPRMLYDRRRSGCVQLMPGVLWSRVTKRELLAAHYLTDDRITVYEDAAMTYDVLYHASSVYVTDEKLYMYRRLDQSNLNHYRPDFFRQLRMGLDYMRATLGGRSPELDCQLSGLFTFRVITGIMWEYRRTGSVREAARAAGRQLDETGLMQDISPRGLPRLMQAYILLLKCRLYYPAALAAKGKSQS